MIGACTKFIPTKMQISLNGKPIDVPEPCSAETLIAQLNIGQVRMAMEVNQEIVPRSQYAEFNLKPGDRVEIVGAIGGG